MNTLQAIFSRRSIRSFDTEVLSNDTLRTIVEAAAAAPSAGNNQNWFFIVINDHNHIRAMRALSPGIIGNPTAIIVICTDKNKIRNIKEGNIDEMIWIDLGAALQNMLLAAHELGYGGCPIGSFHKKALEAFLNIPENFDIRLLVVLGKPKNIPKAPPKRPLEEIFLEGKFSGRENG